jgi:glutathione S-transferase
MEHNGLQCVIYAFGNIFSDFSSRGVSGREGDKAIPEVIERGSYGIKVFFERLEKRLCDTTFIAGDFYSMADI